MRSPKLSGINPDHAEPDCNIVAGFKRSSISPGKSVAYCQRLQNLSNRKIKLLQLRHSKELESCARIVVASALKM